MRVATIVGLFVLFGSANAQLVKAPPPERGPFVTDAWLKDGALLIERTITKLVPQVRTSVVRTADGKMTTLSTTVQVPVKEKVTATLDFKDFEIQKRDGKAVSSDDVKKVFKERTTVIVSTSGKAVDEDFVRANPSADFVIMRKPAK